MDEVRNLITLQTVVDHIAKIGFGAGKGVKQFGPLGKIQAVHRRTKPETPRLLNLHLLD